ncbi:MAG TPA: FIST N-terminal domain-containing protein, partial [Anaerolineales bacterium]|nr:FIST N-terminal domain-containing protein [Anaerolineales bacterium]
MSDQIKFYSALATQPDPADAIDALAAQLQTQGFRTGEDAADLALVFISAHFTQQAEIIRRALETLVSPRVFLGTTAEGVVGDEHEVESQPSISVIAARLPGVELKPFALQEIDWSCILLQPEDFRQIVQAPAETRLFILLADPFSTPIDDVLQSFNLAYPGIPVTGGMSSGALRSSGNAHLY